MRKLSRLYLMCFMGVSLAFAGVAAATEESYLESKAHQSLIDTPVPADNHPVDFHTAINGNGATLEDSVVSSVQSPSQSLPPAIMVSGMNAYSVPVTDLYRTSIVPLPPSGYTVVALRNDNSKAADMVDMSAAIDRDKGTQKQKRSNGADAKGQPYAVVALLIALLGVVSVARRYH